jgi:hypothetical protein
MHAAQAADGLLHREMIWAGQTGSNPTSFHIGSILFTPRILGALYTSGASIGYRPSAVPFRFGRINYETGEFGRD